MDGDYRYFLRRYVGIPNPREHSVTIVEVSDDDDDDDDDDDEDEDEDEEDDEEDDDNDRPVDMDIDIDDEILNDYRIRVSGRQGSTSSPIETDNGGNQHVEKKSTTSDKKEEKAETNDDTDGLSCPICLDTWSSGGDHQICCLPCGHIYGLSCIKRWLLQTRRQGKCPQCNSKCTLKDVRILYASRIVAVDEELQQKVRTLEAKCGSLEKKVKEARDDADWCKKEDGWRKREAELCLQVDQLKKRLDEFQNVVNSNKWTSYLQDVHSTLPSAVQHGSLKLSAGQKSFDAETYQQRCQNSFPLLDAWVLDGARLFDVDVFGQTIVVARRLSGARASQALTKISLLAPHAAETIQLHPCIKAVKDLCVSPHSRLVLLASLGNRLTVLSTESNNSVLTYDLPTTAWSCAWDLHDGNYMYAGLQNGMVLEFDIRQTVSPVESMSGLASNPVHTLHSLSPDSSLGSGMRSILTASSVGLCHWNFGDSDQRVSLIPESVNQGVCISAAYGPRSGDIVASFRPKIETSPNTSLTRLASTLSSSPSSSGAQGTHVAYRRVDTTYQKIAATCTTVSNVRLSKSAVIDGLNENSLFASEDEVTGDLGLRELPSFRVFQSLKCKKNPIYDVKFLQQSDLLGCLSEGSLQLFKLKPHSS